MKRRVQQQRRRQERLPYQTPNIVITNVEMECGIASGSGSDGARANDGKLQQTWRSQAQSQEITWE